jgi:ABC-type branched-subunit amino acid transport system ATPase component
MAISDLHYIMEKGAIAWHGSNEELRSNPELRSRYLGV